MEPKNFRDLVALYEQAPEARRCSQSRRRNRERALTRAVVKWGGRTIFQLEERGFRAQLYDWRDTFADRPAEGNFSTRAVCTVLNWAVDRGYMRDNPAAGLKPLQYPANPHANSVWTQAEIDMTMILAAPDLQDVITVALFTGLRESDVIRIQTADCETGWLRAVPRKTEHSSGVKLELPYRLIPPLAAVIDRLLVTRLSGGLLLRRRDGSDWTEREVRREFARVRFAALRFHDLRGTLTTWLLESGCTEAEVGAITGSALARGNTRAYAARTRELAINAYRKLAARLENRDGVPKTRSSEELPSVSFATGNRSPGN